MELRDKVAMITGGARIGQVVARALASRGCSLALTYRGSRDTAEATASAAKAAGVNAVALRADAVDESQVRAAVLETAKSLGRLDILINMASIYVKTPNPTASDWSAALDSNAKSAFLFSINAAPIMKKSGGGRIVNFSDWLPTSGRPHYKDYIPYFTSKAAVAALTQSLAVEFAPDILVNAIAPAAKGTVFQQLSEAIPGFAEMSAAANPLGRVGDPETDIAPVAVFLASDDSRYVTGETIHVDGGQHIPRYNSKPADLQVFE